jgi:hypothetical protein
MKNEELMEAIQQLQLQMVEMQQERNQQRAEFEQAMQSCVSSAISQISQRMRAELPIRQPSTNGPEVESNDRPAESASNSTDQGPERRQEPDAVRFQRPTSIPDTASPGLGTMRSLLPELNAAAGATTSSSAYLMLPICSADPFEDKGRQVVLDWLEMAISMAREAEPTIGRPRLQNWLMTRVQLGNLQNQINRSIHSSNVTSPTTDLSASVDYSTVFFVAVTIGGVAEEQAYIDSGASHSASPVASRFASSGV